PELARAFRDVEGHSIAARAGHRRHERIRDYNGGVDDGRPRVSRENSGATLLVGDTPAPSIHAGTAADLGYEDPRKMRGIVQSHLRGDGGDAVRRLDEQHLGDFDS